MTHDDGLDVDHHLASHRSQHSDSMEYAFGNTFNSYALQPTERIDVKVEEEPTEEGENDGDYYETTALNLPDEEPSTSSTMRRIHNWRLTVLPPITCDIPIVNSARSIPHPFPYSPLTRSSSSQLYGHLKNEQEMKTYQQYASGYSGHDAPSLSLTLLESSATSFQAHSHPRTRRPRTT